MDISISEGNTLPLIGCPMYRCIVVLFILASCSGNLTGGKVIDKDYRPAYITWDHSCHKVGKTRTCISVPIDHPARYEINLKYCWNDKCVQAPHQLTEGEYNAVTIGQWWGDHDPIYTPPPTFGDVLKFLFFYGLLPAGAVIAIYALVVWYREKHR